MPVCCLLLLRVVTRAGASSPPMGNAHPRVVVGVYLLPGLMFLLEDVLTIGAGITSAMGKS